jgi:hypothetical protein
MSKIGSSTNKFFEAVNKKITTNGNKIKVSLGKEREKLKEVLNPDDLEALKVAAEKMEEARNLSKDVFIKKM